MTDQVLRQLEGLTIVSATHDFGLPDDFEQLVDEPEEISRGMTFRFSNGWELHVEAFTDHTGPFLGNGYRRSKKAPAPAKIAAKKRPGGSLSARGGAR